MSDKPFVSPQLIEPGTKYILSETLRRCRETKYIYFNTYMNIVLLMLFLLIFGSFLYYKFKGRMSPVEAINRDIEKQTYVVSLLQKYQSAKIKESQSSITNLPPWEESEILGLIHRNK